MKLDAEIVFIKNLNLIMRSKYIIVLLMCVWINIQAQEIPIGTWRSHFNFQETHLVESADSKVFAATAHGLIYFDEEDNSLNKLTKIDGLSDVGITALAFDESLKLLTVGYGSGNLDIITSEGITNNRILLESDVTENKTVNHLSYYKNFVHVATDFGVLAINLESQLVEEAYQNLGENGEVLKIYESTIVNGQIFLATPEGVIMGELESGDNLQDFNNWERFSGSEVDGKIIYSLTTLNNIVYALASDTLYKYINDSWIEVPVTLAAGEILVRLKTGDDRLLVISNSSAYNIDNTGSQSQINSGNAMIKDIIEEGPSNYWYADQIQGLTQLSNGSTNHFVLNGPISNHIDQVKFLENGIYAFPELSLTGSYSNNLGISKFENGVWSNVVPGQLGNQTNISDVENNDQTNYTSSFSKGVYNQSSDTFYDHTNSPLEEDIPDSGRVLVSAMNFDSEGQLWISQFGNYSLLKLSAQDKWEQFRFGFSAGEEPFSMAINKDDQIWMTLGMNNESGVLAYDIEKNISRYITSSSTNLPSNKVNKISFTKNGEIWLATDKGVVYFPPSFGVIEDHSIDVIQPVFEDNFLFENKAVTALAIDDGNRKWMGTQDGLWLFDENISTVLLHFTTSNSPLPTNDILDLAIHPDTGEVFIVTEEGIVSYRSDATESNSYHQDVKIFPNPVLPGFLGQVGLSGLATDVTLKITNVSGKLVRQINAAGGGASWDVADYNGKRVSSGVYLVFSSTVDGTETFVGKIAVIN